VSSSFPIPQQQYDIASFFSQLPSRADLPSSTHGPGSFDSYDQYPTENGSTIIAKPLKQPLYSNPVYEDYLHVVVACLLAFALIVLLGLIIRHYGLTLPSLIRSQRSKRNRSPAGDTDRSDRRRDKDDDYDRKRDRERARDKDRDRREDRDRAREKGKDRYRDRGVDRDYRERDDEGRYKDAQRDSGGEHLNSRDRSRDSTRKRKDQ